MRDDGMRQIPLEQQSLSALAASAMAALYEADFVVEMEVIRARVLNRGAERLFEQVQDEDGTWHLRYRPMVELLLHHVRDLAQSDRPADERRAEIVWALESSGF